jgi:competence protein ComEA
MQARSIHVGVMPTADGGQVARVSNWRCGDDAVHNTQGGISMQSKFRNLLATLVLAGSLVLPAFAATPVNINKADATTIAKSLDGIGQSRAKAIVAWRDAHGPFKKVEDLGQIKGIGKSTLERNRDAIRFTGDLPPPTATASAKKSSHRKPKAAVAKN